jgi:hypothetical protein
MDSDRSATVGLPVIDRSGLDPRHSAAHPPRYPPVRCGVRLIERADRNHAYRTPAG